MTPAKSLRPEQVSAEALERRYRSGIDGEGLLPLLFGLGVLVSAVQQLSEDQVWLDDGGIEVRGLL